jgi:hypothetical protein
MQNYYPSIQYFICSSSGQLSTAGTRPPTGAPSFSPTPSPTPPPTTATDCSGSLNVTVLSAQGYDAYFNGDVIGSMPKAGSGKSPRHSVAPAVAHRRTWCCI